MPIVAKGGLNNSNYKKDLNIKKSRKILGKNKIIGVTCHNSKKFAMEAKNNGADYIAFGSFFKSVTKKTPFRANLTILRWAKKKINIPSVAIGGINNSNYKKILSSGANYIAFGAFFRSSTKKTTYNANLALLRWSKKKINIPVVAIGGINSSNYKKILSNGAKLIACSGYIWNNKKLDPVSAIKKFK